MTVFSPVIIDAGVVRVNVISVTNNLYVPLRLLVASLGMNWSGQGRKLESMADRLHLRVLAVRSPSGLVINQPCIRADRLDSYLWSLRPFKADVKERLASLQDHWPDALAAFYGIDTNAPDYARALALAEKTASRKIAELEKVIEQLRARPGNPVESRYGKPLMDIDAFIRMKDLAQRGMDNATIARELRCSRTMVSLFLAGKYLSTHASNMAFTLLISAGWTPETKHRT